MIQLIYLTVLLPFLGFLFNGMFGRKIKNEKIIGMIGSGTIGISFLIVVGAFFQTLRCLLNKGKSIVNLFTWLHAGGLI